MVKKTTILIVDDDPQLIRLVRTNLESVSYQVLVAMNARAAFDTIDKAMPDLVVLDIMLPEVDGYEILRRIREFAETPVIMLTAKVEDIDKVKGLKFGADDYITKPFNVPELLARIEAVLRRSKPSTDLAAPRSFSCGDVAIDFLQRRVMVRGQEIPITLTEYKLLACLINNLGRVMLHRELLARVWGPEYQDESEYLRAYIRHLRQKVELDPHHPKYIISKPGMGYTFVCPDKPESG